MAGGLLDLFMGETRGERQRREARLADQITYARKTGEDAYNLARQAERDKQGELQQALYHKFLNEFAGDQQQAQAAAQDAMDNIRANTPLSTAMEADRSRLESEGGREGAFTLGEEKAKAGAARHRLSTALDTEDLSTGVPARKKFNIATGAKAGADIAEAINAEAAANAVAPQIAGTAVLNNQATQAKYAHDLQKTMYDTNRLPAENTAARALLGKTTAVSNYLTQNPAQAGEVHPTNTILDLQHLMALRAAGIDPKEYMKMLQSTTATPAPDTSGVINRNPVATSRTPVLNLR